MKKTCLLAIVAAVFGPFIPAIPVFAQGTAFTYQGRLNNGGSPASGSYDFTSTLFNALSGPGQVGTVVTNMATAVSNGLFTVTLDFGANFPGADRWLEIGVRTNGVGGFATLSPRQKLTPTPYAMTAENLNGTVSSGGLSGTYGSAVTFNNAGNAFAGTFTGNGGGLTNVNAATLGGFGANAFWQLNGNSGTTPGVNFLGTPDNQPLELHVNGQRASRLEPTIDNVNISNAVNVIQGSPANFVPAGVHGATIAGGGAAFYFGTGVANTVGDNYGTIGGGVNNNIMSNAWESTVAGGNVNWIYPGAYRSTIGGGWNNAIETNANTSFIGGGFGNVVDVGAIGATIGGGGTPGYINQVSSTLGTVAGGSGNVIQANANDSTVAGGRQNQINYGAWGGFIGGGHGNLIQTNDQYSTIGGGYQNTGNGNYSTVGGGFLNSSSGDMAAVGGGFGNTASGIGAFIGGGGVTKLSNGYYLNPNTASGNASVIGGGLFNSVPSGGTNAFIGGGSGNTASSPYTTISGGQGNSASGYQYGYATVGGGSGNAATNDYATAGGGSGNVAGAPYATVSGGDRNIASATNSTVGGGLDDAASGIGATVSGGTQNTVTGAYSTVPGGENNYVSGQFSFAAGYNAQAPDNHSFVWGDGSRLGLSQGPNSFSVLATGGFWIFSGVYPAGIELAPGASAWSTLSDRNAKKNIQPVDYQAVLAKLVHVPVAQWNYKWESDDSVPNIGPMAQDFKGAFYPGRDDKVITTLEFDGVELAAIQGLNEKLQQKETEIAELKQRLEALEKIIRNQKSN